MTSYRIGQSFWLPQSQGISPSDANWDRKWSIGYSSTGVAIPELVRLGMPRLEDKILECAFYLYPSRAAAEAGHDVGGTGFVVARKFANSDRGIPYLVTNKHVACTGGCSVVRFTKNDGSPDYIELEPHDWTPHPTHDVAAVAGNVNVEIHRVKWASYDDMVTRQAVVDRNIGIGDDVFMVGRFIGNDGKTVNRPSVRFGNLSMDVGHILSSRTGLQEESYAVEMRSKPGYSGSPVFVYDFLQTRARQTREHGFLLLLGVEWGAIEEKRKVRNKWDKEHPEDYVPEATGMNGVVPAWRIAELLNMDSLKRPFDDAERAFRLAASQERAYIVAQSVNFADAAPARD